MVEMQSKRQFDTKEENCLFLFRHANGPGGARLFFFKKIPEFSNFNLTPFLICDNMESALLCDALQGLHFDFCSQMWRRKACSFRHVILTRDEICRGFHRLYRWRVWCSEAVLSWQFFSTASIYYWKASAAFCN